MKLWICLVLVISGCASISIDTIDTCSLEIEEFLGTSIMTKLNCSDLREDWHRDPTASERWAKEFKAYQKEQQLKDVNGI